MIRHLSLLLCALLLAGSTRAQSVSISTGPIDSWSSAAYDATNDVFLVVWEDNSGFLSGQVVTGQFVRSDGTLRGSRFTIGVVNNFLYIPTHPRVANVALRDAFVVVWESADAGTIQARAVSAGAPGPLPGVVTVAQGLRLPEGADVGGDATGLGDAATVVWRDDGVSSRIRAASVSVAANGSLTVSLPVDLTSGANPTNTPAISKSGGAPGRHLVAWRNSGRITGVVIDHGLVSLGAFSASALGTAFSGQLPGVDGDGTSWLVAYPTANSSSSDIRGCKVSFHAVTGQTTTEPEVVLAGEPNLGELEPVVAWVGGSYFVGYSLGATVHVKSVDPFTCLPCEGDFTLFTSAASHPPRGLAIASELSGAPTATRSRELALMAWAGRAIGNPCCYNIEGMMLPADDGIVTDLGGGCARGGTSFATCAVTGNASFALRLQGAVPMSQSWAVISAGQLLVGFPCGACTLIPDPVLGVVVSVGATDEHGDAALSFAIPPDPVLVGATLLTQWLTAAAPSACAIGIDFSNALSVQIQ